MSYCCYIIYSSSIDRYYVGYSSDIDERIKQHINGEFGGKSYTCRARDWQIFHIIKCDSIEQAVFVEGRIKSMKSRTFIENLKKNPEMSEKILQEYYKKDKRGR